jgi:hypothetical protein
VNEDDSFIAFFSAVGDCLEIAVRHFKAGNPDAAAVSLAQSVELCEQNPAYAMFRSADLGSSLQSVVHGCISNAIAKGRSGPRMLDLLARIQAISQRPLH